MGSTQDIDILDIAEGSNPTITKDELRELLTKNQDKIKKTKDLTERLRTWDSRSKDFSDFKKGDIPTSQTAEVSSTQPSLQNTVIEVKKLKKKLEEMLRYQELPVGSNVVQIDDLTAAHNETNVKLERLDKLEEIETSAEKAEENLRSAEEELTEREANLNSLESNLQETEEELASNKDAYGENMEGYEQDKKYWSEHGRGAEAAEFLDSSKAEADKANSEIKWNEEHRKNLKKEHTKTLTELNQAQKDYESARKIAANMKLERDQLKNDIATNLGPLVEKINKFHRDFISTKKSNQVVEKSNKVKNELEELKKELTHTEDQVDEHKELVQHGIIKTSVIQIGQIDQVLQDLTIKHDKILEELGEKDDRNTSGINLEEYVTRSHHMVLEEHERVRSFFIERFNIPETKLVTNSEKQRLNLEVDLAIFRQKKKLINKFLRTQESTVAELEYMQMDKMRGKQVVDAGTYIHKPPPDALQYMTGTNVEPPTIQPDQTLVQEFTWISTLEIEFRKLIADIFKNINNWWVDLVPDNVRNNARKHNDTNPDFLERQKTQDFGLLEFVNFSSLTQIFTSRKGWEYFSPVFPKLVGYNENSWFDSLKNKFRDTGYCRNRIGHNNRLDEMNHDTLKVNYSFFVKCIEDFRNR